MQSFFFIYNFYDSVIFVQKINLNIILSNFPSFAFITQHPSLSQSCFFVKSLNHTSNTSSLDTEL